MDREWERLDFADELLAVMTSLISVYGADGDESEDGADGEDEADFVEPPELTSRVCVLNWRKFVRSSSGSAWS